MSEIVVEVVCKNLSKNLWCRPLRERIRGKYIAHHATGKFRQEDDEAQRAAGIPDTPGMCIALDVKAKKVRIFDPLASDQYASVAAAWAKAVKQQPAKTRKIDLGTDLDAARWSNWICVGLRDGDLELKSGEAPKPIDVPKRKPINDPTDPLPV